MPLTQKPFFTFPTTKHSQKESLKMWKLQVQPASESLKHHHHPLFNLYSERERRSSDCVSGTTQTYASSRWCPTPEQLRALEEFYKRGIRTPSTYQIQQITAQLRRFGKIEGKNVFYWFQNHKARERQRIRRRLSMGSSSSVLFSDHSSKQIQDHVFRSLEGKPPKDIQAVQNKSRPTNYAALQEGDRAESDRDGWIKLLIDREIKQISSVKESNNNSNNNGISPSRHSHVTKGSNLFTSHNSTSSSSNEAHYYSCINWQQNEQAMFSKRRRPDKTLELFPIHCEEKANESEGRVQFYEFL